jgi:hypothetical protein
VFAGSCDKCIRAHQVPLSGECCALVRDWHSVNVVTTALNCRSKWMVAALAIRVVDCAALIE